MQQRECAHDFGEPARSCVHCGLSYDTWLEQRMARLDAAVLRLQAMAEAGQPLRRYDPRRELKGRRA